jgi:nucleotide-binding universal stress UspA family protein
VFPALRMGTMTSDLAEHTLCRDRFRVGTACSRQPAPRRLTSCRWSPGDAGRELVLVNAQNLQTLDVSDISAVMTVEVDRRLAARQSRIALRKAVKLCRKAQANFVTRAEIGSPAETIDHVAREVGANQIVMGTRGLGSLGNLFLGSVTTKVVRLAEVPVTLVK